MTSVPLSYFIKLVHLDQIIDLHTEQLNSLESALKEQQKHTQTLDQSFDDTQQQQFKTKTRVYQLEKRLDEIVEQQHSNTKKLQATSNFKEYNALEQHLKRLAQEKEETEGFLESAWQEQEDGIHLLDDLKKDHQEKRKLIDLSLSDIHKKKESIGQTLKDLIAERPALCKNIAKELLAQYTLLRQKIKNPVVPLKNNTCSACYYIIPPQKINNIFLYILEHCSNCFRFLYAPSIL